MENFNPNQVVMVTLEQLVPKNHQYRKLLQLLNFSYLCKSIKKLNNEESVGRTGYDIVSMFKCIFLQFLEDLSDRQLQKHLEDSNAAKLFCGFNINERTPSFTLFTKIRYKIGTEKLSKIFIKLQKKLKAEGLLLENFTFVDSTAIIHKNNLWKERDKAIAEKIKKVNNVTLPKLTNDDQARLGCKGKNKYWFGYKTHVSADMQSGLINKIALTPANKSDGKSLKHICPKKGAIYGDKGYCTKAALIEIKKRGCHDATIKKDNMKIKDKELDKWHTKLRMPYERIFSKIRKRTRYIGIAKNQFTMFFEAIIHNSKKLILDYPELKLYYDI